MDDPTYSLNTRFDMTGRVVVITGGAGMLGRAHAEAVAEAGAIPVIADLDEAAGTKTAGEIGERFGRDSSAVRTDVTSEDSVSSLLEAVLDRYGRVDVLINNAAVNPQVENDEETGEQWTRLEKFPIEVWQRDIAVGLTGALLCSRVIGSEMASKGAGVILNIASDLALIAPDQRIYSKPGLPPDRQPVKPVSYSVVKGGLVALTRYLATYWAEKHVRVNALLPGGVYADQPEDFVERLSSLIPMGRMADRDEYQAAVLFLCSDASSYMTGANLVIDGGRTAW